MLEASLAADEIHLSDLSAASITSFGPYLGSASPPLNRRRRYIEAQPLESTSTSAHFNTAEAIPSSSQMPASSSFSSPSGSGRIRTDQSNKSGDAWTPSSEFSSSHSSSNNRSARKSEPVAKDANESMGSSLGTFDFSNASFSESFLRQAGAHMLAGLDEAGPPPASSSSPSPRYRTSSSPTVTARPVRADQGTPFTGKSLRTRMAEAGMLDSPTSSDSSSPASSPTARILPHSYTDAAPSDRSQKRAEHIYAEPYQHSSLVGRFSAEHSASSIRPPNSSLQHHASLRHATNAGGISMAEYCDWQEGLSMVPEESYVGEASQLPSSPAQQEQDSHRSILPTTASSPLTGAGLSKHAADASLSSVPPPMPDSITGPSPVSSASLPAGLALSNSLSPLEREPLHSQNVPIAKAGCALSAPNSPQPRSSAPATPQSAPRTINTSRSFARLRMVTPARSSPLSRVVDFSPSSAGGSSQWHSPGSQQNINMAEVVSPSKNVTDDQLPHLGEVDRLLTSEEQAHQVEKPVEKPPTPAKHSSANEFSEEQPTELPMEQQRNLCDTQALETPKDKSEGSQTAATPSRIWSPATSASFATPSSQRRQTEAWSSAPATPILPQALTDRYTDTPKDAPSPKGDFGTPQWSPTSFPIPVKPEDVKVEDEKPRPDASLKGAHEEEESLLSSTCSSTSERKQSGDVSAFSQLAAETSPSKDCPLSIKDEGSQADVSLPTQACNSPSAARFSRMQLSRIPPLLPLSQLPSVPELGLVENAFDSLSQLSNSRASRLLAQLTASTTRIEELESALDARERERAELDEVRYTLSQLSLQYQELVQDADRKDATIVELVENLKAGLQSRSHEKDTLDLKRELEKEKRLREIERRDYEVRMAGLLNPTTSSPAVRVDKVDDNPAVGNTARMQREIENAREQLRLTLEKDFEVRRAMEQRALRDRVEELERELAVTTACPASNYTEDVSPPDQDDVEKDELKRRNDELTNELDRRLEELSDLRAELEAAASQRDAVEERAAMLEEELAEAHASHEGKDRVEEELEETRTVLAERDSQIERLEETLSLASSQLATVTGERDELLQQIEVTSLSHSQHLERIAMLEGHILNLEVQLRTARTPVKPTSATTTTPTTPSSDRIHKLERELASLNLELLKLGKANDALQEDNIHFSIALSAKQLELGMVKRNARFALKHASKPIHIGLSVSKTVESTGARASSDVQSNAGEKEVLFPSVPQTRVNAEVGDKENRPLQEVNQARSHARQLLAQRKAMTALKAGDGGGSRTRLALAA